MQAMRITNWKANRKDPSHLCMLDSMLQSVTGRPALQYCCVKVFANLGTGLESHNLETRAELQSLSAPDRCCIHHNNSMVMSYCSPLTLYKSTCSKKMMGLSLRIADFRRAFELATVEQATSCTPGILWK